MPGRRCTNWPYRVCHWWFTSTRRRACMRNKCLIVDSLQLHYRTCCALDDVGGMDGLEPQLLQVLAPRIGQHGGAPVGRAQHGRLANLPHPLTGQRTPHVPSIHSNPAHQEPSCEPDASNTEQDVSVALLYVDRVQTSKPGVQVLLRAEVAIHPLCRWTQRMECCQCA